MILQQPWVSVFIGFISVGGFIGYILLLKLIFDRKERKIQKCEKLIVEKAISGNEFAIEFLNEDRYVKLANIGIINAALNGNEHALKILKMEKK